MSGVYRKKPYSILCAGSQFLQQLCGFTFILIKILFKKNGGETGHELDKHL